MENKEHPLYCEACEETVMHNHEAAAESFLDAAGAADTPDDRNAALKSAEVEALLAIAHALHH